jgi:uncharacterized protein YdeI (YjbR/CyaY-like superfamily)
MVDPMRAFTNCEAWRQWLTTNHASESVLWVVYFKVHTGKPSLRYEEAIEEALCFGWVDSIVRRIDDDSYAQKFTPRRIDSVWSETNRKRIARLIRDGRMTPAGMAKVTFDVTTVDPDAPVVKRPTPVMNDEISQALAARPKALAVFTALSPSLKKQYLGWITSAKKAETQKRRLAELMTTLEAGKKLGMK